VIEKNHSDPSGSSSPARALRLRWVIYGALAALALVSIAFTKIALFVLVGSFLAFLSVDKRAPRPFTLLSLGAACASGIGFLRFLVTEAVPGIVQGGTSATGAAAVSRLRELLFAEDVMRKKGTIDPDRDGIGSAAFLGELLGRVGLRGGPRLTPPVLERYPALVETTIGPAAEIAGHYFIICLPARGGGFTARPEDAVDEESAERRFVAYAWPAAEGRGLREAFFIDEHERILFARSAAPQGAAERAGAVRTPACDDAFAPKSREAWQIWRGKRPRDTLPGDRP
jgi:hypothetical protein